MKTSGYVVRAPMVPGEGPVKMYESTRLDRARWFARLYLKDCPFLRCQDVRIYRARGRKSGSRDSPDGRSFQFVEYAIGGR